MTRGYFWKAGEVVASSGPMNADDSKIPFYNCPCVDLLEREPSRRYGFYDSTGWNATPLEDFSKEFRTHLLLLGVS